jgi:hypothetical protein
VLRIAFAPLPTIPNAMPLNLLTYAAPRLCTFRIAHIDGGDVAVTCFKAKIDSLLPGHGKDDISRFRWREPRSAGLDIVNAFAKRRHFVMSATVCSYIDHFARTHIADSDRNIRNCRSIGVLNDTAQALGFLSHSGPRRANYDEEVCEKTSIAQNTGSLHA